MGERYVALGLGRPRAQWFADVTRWANSASLPLEFVKCVSAEEAAVRLRSGRVWSALLVDPTIPGVDRDLFQLARAHQASVLAVSRGESDMVRWLDLGATAVLPEPLDRKGLAEVLDSATTRVTDRTRRHIEPEQPGWRGSLVAVTGTPGSGISTTAMALAQGMVDEPRWLASVALADLALEADQALLHDTREIIPGLQELVEAHRMGTPDRADIVAATFAIETRGYNLLVGLRRRRDWAALRPHALDATLDSLRRTFKLVVADCDTDTDGRAECGSVEVEERNGLTRLATRSADLVVVVTNPGPRGTRRLVRIVGDLVESGVVPDRLLMVINRGPRSPRARAETASAIPQLLAAAGIDNQSIGSPVFLPDRRRLEDSHPGPAPLPRSLAGPLGSAAAAALDRAVVSPTRASAPERIAPGSLGSFASTDELA